MKIIEEWKPVKNYPDYEVSNFGKVKWAVGRILKPFVRGGGYYFVCLMYGKKFDRRCKSISIHKLVLEAFVGKKPKGKECNHIDGNKSNNFASNLEWVTKSENLKHAIKLGLLKVPCGGKRGPNKKPLKLSDKDIQRIIKLRKNGIKLKPIARHFKVSEVTISYITLGRRNYKRHHQ